MSPNVALTQRQRRAVLALVTSPTLTTAATQVGVSRRTLARWIKDPAFAVEYQAAARESHREARSALMALSRRAVDVLAEGMTEGTAADRTRAARAVLELAVRLNEDDVAARLDELEAEVERWQGQPKLVSSR